MFSKKSVLKNKLLQFYNNATLGGLNGRDDIELLRKIRLLHLLAITAVTILTAMSIIVFMEGKTYLSVINMTAALIYILLQQYLKKTGDYPKASLGGLILSFVFLLYFYLSGGINDTGHLWSFLFPTLATFLIGSKRGFIISILYILIVITADFFNFGFQAAYTMAFKIRFAMAMLTTSLLAFYIGFISENNVKKHTDTNLHLSNVVKGLKQTKIELLEAKEKAEKSNKSKSEFLRNMSHELRTPLNHIIGFSQLIHDEIAGSVSDTQKEYLGDILSSSSHLLSLINDLLNLSRVEAGKLDILPDQIDMAEVLKQTIEMFKTKNNLNFELVIKSLPENILADRKMVIQILNNLISNAVKFTDDKGTVTITASTENENKEIIISVKDTGIGLKAELLDVIFKPFEQVESDLTRRFEGTGLGLALTKELVELHGGEIWVESGGLGKGSTFSFTMPLTAAMKE